MINNKKEYNAKLLLVEDDEADIVLIKEVLEESRYIKELYVVKDGESAMEFLHKKNDYTDAPTPDLILLDLNLPGMNGKQVLQAIKHDEYLRLIPVIILSTSLLQDEVNECYKLHANCYMTKPLDLDDFHEIVRRMEEFWFGCSILPEMQ